MAGPARVLALRRAALGVIRILLEGDYRLSLGDALQRSAEELIRQLVKLDRAGWYVELGQKYEKGSHGI